MGFDGFLSFGGIEIINAQRTQAYVHNLMPSFGLVRKTDDYDNIRLALGQAAYRTPLLDDADWVETDGADDPVPRNPSHGFYGLYPLSIEGIGDSTMSAEVIEGIRDGGAVNSERDATRSIRVHGLLIGDSKLAVESGMTWLRNALRGNACAMHGDLCGYTDLRYFLAPPDVCDPLWTGSYDEHLDGVSLGALDVPSSPLSYFHGEEGQPHAYEWVLPATDGAIIRWGALAFDTDEVLAEHGPVYLRRSNFVLNPSFTVDGASWTETLDGVPTAGVVRLNGDDGYFARAGTTLESVRTNWLPDPSFEHGNPTDNGWRSNGTLTAVTGVSAPNGTHAAKVDARAGGITLEVSLLGPFDLSDCYLKLNIAQSTEDVIVEFVDNSGVVAETTTVLASSLTSTWNAISLHPAAHLMLNYVVRLRTAGAQALMIDAAILSTVDVAFFSGDTAAGGGYTYSWPSGFSGPSRGVDPLSGTTAALTTALTDAPFGSVVLSFDIRAPESEASVLVELLDNTDFVVGNLSLTPSHDWQRVAIGADYGRQVRVRVSGNHQFDVDNFLLEAGSTQNSYFDGSSTVPADYSLVWVSTPNNSISRMTWTGSTLIERRDNWRPFLSLDQGALATTALNIDWSGEIDMGFQLEPFDRTYHRVSCTIGVKKIQELALSVGAATEVDFVLTAATPHAFSTQAEVISFDTLDPTYISDDLTNLAKYPSAELGDASTAVRTNLVPNPSAETVTTGFTSIPGTTGVAAVTNPVSTTAYGTHVARNTWSTASTAAGGGMYIDVTVVAGTVYSFAVNHIKSSITNRLKLRIEWRTAGVTISNSDVADFVATGGTVYSALLEGVTAPATAVIARITVISTAGTSYANWSIASYLEMDGLVANVGEKVTTYFDGASAADATFTYAWAGTANASTSTRNALPVTGWTAAVGAGADGATYRTASQFHTGTYASRTVWYKAPTDDADVVVGGMAATTPFMAVAVADQPYIGSAWVRVSKAQRLFLRIQWYTAAGASISSTDGTPVAVSATTWTRLTASAVAAPVTAAFARVRVVSTSGTGYTRWAASDYIDIDDMMLIFGTADVGFFSGATVGTSAYSYQWNGTANASTSSRVAVVNTTPPLVDPDLPVVPTAPKPPTVPDVALTDQNEWLRYYVEIPAGNVAMWAATVPTLTLSTKTDDVRQVRVRFYPNPFGYEATEIDPTNYCGEFLLSYLPLNSALTISGVTEEAWAQVAGASPVPANQLLYGTGGVPMDWPELTCGIGYIMTVDIVPTTDIDNLDLDLQVNRRE